jgi:hypothetical protein
MLAPRGAHRYNSGGLCPARGPVAPCSPTRIYSQRSRRRQLALQNAHRLIISLYSRPGSENDGCTADLTPTDSVITAPAGLDDGTPPIARVEGNEVPLSPRK